MLGVVCAPLFVWSVSAFAPPGEDPVPAIAAAPAAEEPVAPPAAAPGGASCESQDDLVSTVALALEEGESSELVRLETSQELSDFETLRQGVRENGGALTLFRQQHGTEAGQPFDVSAGGVRGTLLIRETDNGWQVVGAGPTIAMESRNGPKSGSIDEAGSALKSLLQEADEQTRRSAREALKQIQPAHPKP